MKEATMGIGLWCDRCKVAGHICAPEWLLDDGAGPPTAEDDMWFLEHVVAAGYPKVKRDPEPYPGQLSIEDQE